MVTEALGGGSLGLCLCQGPSSSSDHLLEARGEGKPSGHDTKSHGLLSYPLGQEETLPTLGSLANSGHSTEEGTHGAQTWCSQLQAPQSELQENLLRYHEDKGPSVLHSAPGPAGRNDRDNLSPGPDLERQAEAIALK